MEKRSQGASHTPTGTDARLEAMPTGVLEKMLEQIRDRLNDAPDDSRLQGAGHRIQQIIKHRVEETSPFPVTAMRLAMEMDQLGQYDLADRLEEIAGGF